MTLGSICDGIGGWQLAAVRAGIKPVWSSEIDKFCLSVTARHFPETIQLGDINHISDAPKVDIITAGTPCQSLSLAGRREGLKGESGLFFSAIKLVRRINPEFFVWENVPGALSSSGRNDFRIVLEEILKESIPLPKYWANAGVVDGRKCQVAWRILDAQYWGVPQRRKRIFLVADFRGRRAGEILFEREGVSRNSAACEDEKQTVATRPARNVNSAIVAYGIGRDAFNQGRNAQYKPTVERELQPSLTARGAAAVATVYDNHWKDARIKPVGEIAPTVSAMYGTGGLNTPLVKTSLVRRLMPLEYERLQGLPDNWSQGGSDAARYKALGNGMAQPCADWILRRIVERS